MPVGKIMSSLNANCTTAVGRKDNTWCHSYQEENLFICSARWLNEWKDKLQVKTNKQVKKTSKQVKNFRKSPLKWSSLPYKVLENILIQFHKYYCFKFLWHILDNWAWDEPYPICALTSVWLNERIE